MTQNNIREWHQRMTSGAKIRGWLQGMKSRDNIWRDIQRGYGIMTFQSCTPFDPHLLLLSTLTSLFDFDRFQLLAVSVRKTSRIHKIRRSKYAENARKIDNRWTDRQTYRHIESLRRDKNKARIDLNDLIWPRCYCNLQFVNVLGFRTQYDWISLQ